MQKILSYLREIGILLLVVSLLFLPWYLDPFPNPGQSAVVTGIEFFTSGSWSVIVVYILAIVAYAISKFSTRKWASVIPLVIACALHFFTHIWLSAFLDAYGVNLGRGLSSIEDDFGNVEVLAGVAVSWIGFLALAVGAYVAESGQRRTAVLLAWLGAFVGFVVQFYALFYVGLTFFAFLPFQLSLPLIGAVVGLWLGLTQVTDILSDLLSDIQSEFRRGNGA